MNERIIIRIIIYKGKKVMIGGSSGGTHKVMKLSFWQRFLNLFLPKK